MFDPKVFDEMAQRFSSLLAASPAGDIEKNAKALLSSLLGRMDIVSREDFDIQQAILVKTQERLAELESRLQALESHRS